jgi:hypothetical protein
MNLNDVSKREVLDFEDFKKRIHDENYKPLSPQNQQGDKSRSGISAIKREPAYDFVGYADAVFAGSSSINYAGLNVRDPRSGKLVSITPMDSGGITHMGTEISESEDNTGFKILRISEF